MRILKSILCRLRFHDWYDTGYKFRGSLGDCDVLVLSHFKCRRRPKQKFE